MLSVIWGQTLLCANHTSFKIIFSHFPYNNQTKLAHKDTYAIRTPTYELSFLISPTKYSPIPKNS